MIRSIDGTAREARIAELKRLITAGTYETLEKLEEAVDAFLWRDENEGSREPAGELNAELRRGHPK